MEGWDVDIYWDEKYVKYEQGSTSFWVVSLGEGEAMLPSGLRVGQRARNQQDQSEPATLFITAALSLGHTNELK